MLIVDAHCDTLTKIMDTNQGFFINNCHIDLERMIRLHPIVQFFAAFISPEYYNTAVQRAFQIIDKLHFEIEHHSNIISLCHNYNEIMAAIDNSKIAAFLSIEGGEALGEDLSFVEKYYSLGVRSICLTWNHKNKIATGVHDSLEDEGLTQFGLDVVKEMNRLGMIIDASHMSRKSLNDVLENTTKPIIASHSNSYEICGHNRNLCKDDLISISKNGGVIGINLYTKFLTSNKKANIHDVVKHIDYIAEVIGVEHIGLGGDLDGVNETPEGINDICDYYKIFDELARINYSDEDIEKIAGENFLNLIKNLC